MGKPWGILLVPTDPSLLEESVGGSRPPVAWFTHQGWVVPNAWMRAASNANPCDDAHRALIFAWDTESVPAGIFAAWYMADDIGAFHLGLILDDLAMLLAGDPSWGVAPISEWKKDGKSLGRIILLDSDRREVPSE